jgi:DeoR/GlpR family transcriptional regulator of sugar metabolism
LSWFTADLWQSVQEYSMNEADLPRKTALPAQRQNELVKLLEIKGQMSVSDISEYFSVSEDTVRRDLDALAEKGALTRTHGGAVTITALRGSTFALRKSNELLRRRRRSSATARLS